MASFANRAICLTVADRRGPRSGPGIEHTPRGHWSLPLVSLDFGPVVYGGPSGVVAQGRVGVLVPYVR